MERRTGESQLRTLATIAVVSIVGGPLYGQDLDTAGAQSVGETPPEALFAGTESHLESEAIDPAFSEWVFDNTRLTLDLSVRPSYSTRTKDVSNLAAVGLDLHKVFTVDSGDVGTATVQLYLMRHRWRQRRGNL